MPGGRGFAAVGEMSGDWVRVSEPVEKFDEAQQLHKKISRKVAKTQRLAGIKEKRNDATRQRRKED